MRPILAQRTGRPESEENLSIFLRASGGKNRQAGEWDHRLGQNYHFTERERERERGNDLPHLLCLSHPPVWPSSSHFLGCFVRVHAPAGGNVCVGVALLPHAYMHAYLQTAAANDATHLKKTGVGCEAVSAVRHWESTVAVCMREGEAKVASTSQESPLLSAGTKPLNTSSAPGLFSASQQVCPSLIII